MKEYEVKGGKLILGDCIKHMKRMPRKSVDLIIGSPPYAKQRKYLEKGKETNISRPLDEWIDWMVRIYKTSLRVCKGLVAFVIGHGKGAREWDGAPLLLGARLLHEGICLRRQMYYHRNGIMGSGGNDWFRADVEIILCATDGKMKLEGDNTACGHPPKYKPGGVLSYRNVDGSRVNRQVITTISGYEDGDAKTRRVNRAITKIANPGDVLFCGAVGGGHLGSNISHDNEAPYPAQIPNFFIRSCCKPKGVVYDPFGGSGTTGAEAIKLGRSFIMSDIRPSQIELMKRRVKQARKQRGLGLLS